MDSMCATANGSDNNLVIEEWKLEDTNHLKEAMFGTNSQLMDRQMVTKSTVPSCGTSGEQQKEKNQRIQRLIDEMKNLAEEENTSKRHMTNVKRKISELNDELRPVEPQISLRNRLFKTISEIEYKMEVMANGRKDLLSEMQSCVLASKQCTTNGEAIVTFGSNIVGDCGVEAYDKRTDNISKADESALNPPKKSISESGNPKKKCRFSDEVIAADEKKQLLIKKYNLVETKRKRRKPLSTQPMLTSAPNNLTFGVRASRPARMGCSLRHLQSIAEESEQPLETSQENETSIQPEIRDDLHESTESVNIESPLMATKSSMSTNTPNKCEQTLKTPNSSHEKTESPKKPKFELKIKLKPSKSSKSLLNSSPKQKPSIKTEKTSKSKSAVMSTESDIISKGVFEDIPKTKFSESTDTSDNKPIAKSCQTQEAMSEITESKVEVISGKSEQSIHTIETKADEQNVKKKIKIKTEIKDQFIEIVDILSDSEDKENMATEEALPMKSSIKREVMPKKVKTEAPDVNRKELQTYIGFEAKEFRPTVKSTIRPFTPLPVPNSKTGVPIIDMKSFKNYLIISFLDSSVRRFHIEDRNDIMVFEGHRDLVMAMIVVECPKCVDTFILYTAGKEHNLRAFNAITGQLLNSLRLSDEILCLDYSWSHIFVALKNGSVCKLSPIHEVGEGVNTSGSDIQIKMFKANESKPIWAIIAVKPLNNSTIEPMIAVSQNQLQLIDTSDSSGETNVDRILHSMAVKCFAPLYVRTFRQYLFLSFKQLSHKTKSNDKSGDKSILSVYDMKSSSTWKPIQIFPITGLITDLKLNREDLIVSTNNGNILCIDCTQLSIKWMTYTRHSDVKTCVKIEERLVLGTIGGHIDIIHCDQHMIYCEKCETTFAREVDYKEHIVYEHPVFRSLNSPDSSSNKQQSK